MDLADTGREHKMSYPFFSNITEPALNNPNISTIRLEIMIKYAGITKNETRAAGLSETIETGYSMNIIFDSNTKIAITAVKTKHGTIPQFR